MQYYDQELNCVHHVALSEWDLVHPASPKEMYMYAWLIIIILVKQMILKYSP